MLHRLHGDSAVQSQRTGNNATLHTALGDSGSGDGRRHLLRDILHSGENSNLGALITQSTSHRQRILDNADLSLQIGRDVDGGVGDHHEAALILEHTHMAHEAACTLGDQTGLTVQNGLGKAGSLQNALHGDVGLPFLHQLDSDLSGFQLLAVEMDDLIISLILAHLVEHLDDLGLLTDQSTLNNTLTLGIDHSAQSGLVVGVSQGDALLGILGQNIGLQIFKIGKHRLPPDN